MMNKKILRPVGLSELCNEIERTCKNAQIYKYCHLRPYHMIVALNSGDGRTTFIEYLTEMYKENNILNFNCGLDDFIEINFDGSLKQLRQGFAGLSQRLCKPPN